MAHALLLLSLLLSSAASAPLAFDPEPPKPIILQPGQAYSQNFDSLASHGRDNPFPPQDEAGLQAGWWTSTPTYSASSGTPEPGVGGGVFSYGEEGSQERALGSRTSNRVRHTAWGVSLQVDPEQTSDIALWALDITYCGEQWSAGNGTSALIFDYSIVSVDDYTNGHKWGYYDVTPGLWMVKDRLSFTSPVVGGSERGLNGNDPANRRVVKHTLALDDAGKDKIVQLRWTHRNRDDVDHALAVDDLSVTLIPLKAYRSSSGHQRLHSMSWLYAGISVVGVVLTLIAAGLGIMLIVRRRRNEREGRESYARLAVYNDEITTSDEEEAPSSVTTSTSINPVDSDEYDASTSSAYVRHSEL